MNEIESLNDETKDKIVAKAFAQRESARRRSKKAALDKRRAGMKRVMVWVPEEQAKQLKQEASRLCAEFVRLNSKKQEVGDQHHNEQQPSLFDLPNIEWKLYGRQI